MKNFVKFSIILMVVFSLFACARNEKKPFGAEDINYENAGDINKDGPTANEVHAENVAPFSTKISFEDEGPVKNDETQFVEPTADMDEEPDYGGIPIATKEDNNNGF